jgi:GNAT superfamily N-acetyltransferase
MDPALRKKNLSVRLYQAALNYAESQGAKIIEGYPVETNHSCRFMRSLSYFEQAGFQAAAIVRNGRRIKRYTVKVCR